MSDTRQPETMKEWEQACNNVHKDLIAAYKHLNMVERALTLLSKGDCWCEMAVDNPMVKEHSEGCGLAREYFANKEAKG